MVLGMKHKMQLKAKIPMMVKAGAGCHWRIFIHLQIGQFFAIFIHAFQLLWKNDCNYPMAFVYFIGGHALLFFILVRNKMASSFESFKNACKLIYFFFRKTTKRPLRLQEKTNKVRLKHVECLFQVVAVCSRRKLIVFIIKKTSLVIRFQIIFVLNKN